MKKAISYLTSACVIFTLLTIGLHIAEFALGGGIAALGRQLLLLLACLLFAASNFILGAERLPIGVRMLLHYIAIGVVYFTLAFFLAFGLFAATFHSAIDRRRQLERELEE